MEHVEIEYGNINQNTSKKLAEIWGGKENKFNKVLTEMETTYNEKNRMYGDSFGKSVEKYGMISALTRISDKFNRLEQMILNDNDGTDDERLRDTLLDMASYCVMTIVELENV